MFDYKRPLKVVPINPINFEMIEAGIDPNEKGFERVFDITDDFDLNRFDEAYHYAGAFDYYVCSIKKFEEIKVQLTNELKLTNGQFYLRDKKILGESSIRVRYLIDLDTIKKSLE